ncbi:peptidase M23-like protein [Roseiarcus fermentans]|uniref:Peptidase M23-like protein n=1 Tax=Roseiarcus fermentans TaxID=1473586 RepID=A0A366FC62_9HYPH|nr:M23 family metallopeptidase [Roseiarcus fermentans]RBP12231.1 peptidase M23-like protein [Roseiarcus fermentans]
MGRFARGGLAAVVVLAAGLPGAALAQDAAPQPEREKFRWPLRGAIVQPFKAGANDGIDIATPLGVAVHAAADGTVIAAGEQIKSYGRMVVIRHDDGFVTVYADNSELLVQEGDHVRRGQIIAKSGQTGAAPAPRLHFELRKDGHAVDPVPHLVPL